MQLRVNIKLIQRLRVFVAVSFSAAFFVLAYWLNTIFTFEIPHFVLLVVMYIVAISIAFVIVGDRSSQTQQWYENQLVSSRELFATMYDQSPVPYITLDEAGRITTCNQAAGALFKTAVQNLIGKELTPLLTHEDSNKLSIILGTIQAGTTLARTEAQVQNANSEVTWVHISIFQSQRFNQRLVTLIDIEAEKKIDKAKSEFLSLATHQLRTPITAIKWNVDLLTRSLGNTASEKQAEYLLKASRNVARMIALINDFLSVSKLETGTFSTTITQVNLPEYIIAILDTFQHTITEKQLHIAHSFSIDKLVLSTDESLLHIVVSNLLSNAVKYTPPHGTVTAAFTHTDTQFTLTIADSGIGIPEHELPSLFKKFYRASNAQQQHTEGTGLGLYVVKQSVEKLGGEITVASKENEGTTFIITMPIHQSIQS